MLSDNDTRYTLLTGATGFIGHRVLAELLRDGRRCAVTVRAPSGRSIGKLTALLADFELDVDAAIADGRLLPIECDLRQGMPIVAGVEFRDVVHAAACTRFTSDANGEPGATNVAGTGRLVDWCDSVGVEHFHFVSSAYACGRWPRRVEVPETFHDSAPAFHNDYEASKWQAEEICRRWAGARAGRSVTVYRPSVVVGEFDTGRATKFDAFYIPVRATELLSRTFNGPSDTRRWAVPLRIKGRPGDWQNIVPIDYVAAMIARIVRNRTAHGRVYHLTHPSPPTNAHIKSALEEYFRLRGGRFVEPSVMDCVALNEYERLFADVSRSVEHYVIDTPRYARSNSTAAEGVFGITCPKWDATALRRLFAYAQSVDWSDKRRRRQLGTTPGAVHEEKSPSVCATYFEQFLPAYVNRSNVARMTALSVSVRFEIDDEPLGEWVCHFERGRLVQVVRAPAAVGVRADVGYRSTVAGFWKSISGRHHPQELFLRGHAHISGDVERALKMAMILNAFVREFPCDEQTLRRIAAERRVVVCA
jgi:nucleoside-diphosphate-sugar epimerase